MRSARGGGKVWIIAAVAAVLVAVVVVGVMVFG